MDYPGQMSKGSIKAVLLTVDKLYEELKAKFIGPHVAKKTGKGLIFSYQPSKSLSSLAVESALAAGSLHSKKLVESLETITSQYLDASKERTKAKILQIVQTSINSEDDLEKLSESLGSVFDGATSEIQKIVETEATTARNLSGLDAIGKVSATTGIDDPTVFWVTIKDNITCKECKRMYLQADGVTPRVWKMSQLGSGYFKKGMASPTFAPIHPNCRCQPTLLRPGYGFDQSGHVTFKSVGWDEWKSQNP